MKTEYPVRLQVFLAKCGAGSRRSCEELIRSGRVTINSRRVTELGTKVGQDDVVCLDYVPMEPSRHTYYFALNKPRGYVCTNHDPNETAYARNLIDIEDRNLLFNVGRLDKDSQGLVFFTNDGDWANLIAHPSSQTEKEYIVRTDRDIAKRDMDRVWRGEVRPYKIKSYDIIDKREVRIILTEGKNRELRRIMEALGYGVKRLTRVRIGSVRLDDLPCGMYRKLTAHEIRSFRLMGGNAK